MSDLNTFIMRLSCSETKSDCEPGRDKDVNTTRPRPRSTAAGAMILFALCLAFAQGSRCYAQAQAPPQAQAQTNVAELHEPAQPLSTGPVADVGTTARTTPGPSTPVADPGMALALEKELATMKARMEQISAQLAE